MAVVAIVGGHGKIALKLIPLLQARGHEPVPLIRSHQHAADIETLGASWRFLDIEASSPRDFIETLRGHDVVVFAAGGGPDGNAERKRTVDLEGSMRSVQAAESLGIRRFLQVSAMGVDRTPDPSLGDVWEAYVKAKREADAIVRVSTLDWTIVRPGRLTDEPGTGLVSVGRQLESGQVPREDVAAVLAAAIDEPHTIHHQFDLIGGDVPIEEALSSLP